MNKERLCASEACLKMPAVKFKLRAFDAEYSMVPGSPTKTHHYFQTHKSKLMGSIHPLGILAQSQTHAFQQFHYGL